MWNSTGLPTSSYKTFVTRIYSFQIQSALPTKTMCRLQKKFACGLHGFLTETKKMPIFNDAISRWHQMHRSNKVTSQTFLFLYPACSKRVCCAGGRKTFFSVGEPPQSLQKTVKRRRGEKSVQSSFPEMSTKSGSDQQPAAQVRPPF